MAIRPRRRPAVNPLQATVDSTIAGQIKPYQGAIGQAGTLFAGDAAYANQASHNLGAGVGNIMNQVQATGGQQLAQAANANSAGGTNVQRNLDFLHSVFGDLSPGAHDALLRGTALQDAQRQQGNVGLSNQLGLAQASSQNHLAGLSSAGRLANQEWLNRQRTQSSAYRNALGQQIAGIRATGPSLLHQYQQENFLNSLRAGELGNQTATTNANISSQGAGTAARNAEVNDLGVYGYGKKYDNGILGVFNAFNTAKNGTGPQFDATGKPLPATAVKGADTWHLAQLALHGLAGINVPRKALTTLLLKWETPARLRDDVEAPALLSLLKNSGAGSADIGSTMLKVYGKNWRRLASTQVTIGKVGNIVGNALGAMGGFR